VNKCMLVLGPWNPLLQLIKEGRRPLHKGVWTWGKPLPSPLRQNVNNIKPKRNNFTKRKRKRGMKESEERMLVYEVRWGVVD